MRGLVVAVAAAVLLAPGAASAGQASPAETLRTEMSYAASGQYRKFYALYTARFRAACPFAVFADHVSAVGSSFRGLRVRIVSQKVRGDRAVLGYEYVRSGRVVGSARGDVYVRNGGLWYDELDRVTNC